MSRWLIVVGSLAVLGAACGEVNSKDPDAGPTADAAPTIDGDVQLPDGMVDDEAPETTLTAAPTDPTAVASYDFAFTSDEPGTFQCRVDGAAFAACTSPHPVTVADGEHTFEVYAVDEAENADPSPATHTWTVDTAAPDTTITTAPAALDNSVDVAFEFTADESPVTFECAADGAAFAACTSPHQMTGLANGAHTFTVRAIDAVGNVDATPAEHAWTIDTSTPDTQILSGPSGSVADTGAQFTFESADAVSFECRLDGGSWATCTTPRSYTGLAEGSHTFEVRAVNATATVDPTPATRTWTIDLTAPDTTIDSGPSGTVGGTSATFTFSSSESPVTFECRLDAAAFAPCTSPHTVTGVTGGSHTFRVRARDAAGNLDASPASRTWTIDLTGPTVTIASGPVDLSDSSAAQFSFTANEAATFECSVHAQGGTPSWQSCTSPASYSGLTDGNHTFTVRGTDPFGNTGAVATWDWSIDTDPPTATITTQPSSPTKLTTLSFSFTADEAGSTFQCSLTAQGAAASWSSCTSPRAYTSVAEGDYTFRVRATDPASNTGTADTYDLTVDRTGPTVTISTGPSGPTASTTATFGFTTEAGAALECALDQTTSWSACDSATSHTVSGLSQGAHTFYVRATDAATNTGAPASRSWSVDTEPPVTVMGNTPPATYPVNYGTFTFSVQVVEAGVTYECRLNAGAWSDCISPYNLTGATHDASNTFEVRASDSLGNADASPASYSWTVTRGLILYYPFNGDATNHSVLGGTHDGVSSGTVAWDTSLFGRGAKFSGSNSISLPNTRTPLSRYHEYTVAFWYYDTGAQGGRIIDFLAQEGDGCVVSGGNNSTTIGCAGNGTVEQKTYPHKGGWLHVALQYKGTAQGDGAGGPVEFWLNGAHLGNYDLANGNKLDFFGDDQDANTDLGATTQVTLDELRIYNRAFGQIELCTDVMGGIWDSVDGYCRQPVPPIHFAMDGSFENLGWWGSDAGASAIEFVGGKINGAAQFLGSPDSVANLYGVRSQFANHTDYTIGFWFQQSSVLDGGVYLDFYCDSCGAAAAYWGGMRTSNDSAAKSITTCYETYYNTGGCKENVSFSFGSWHHLMYVVRGGYDSQQGIAETYSIETYFNGSLTDTITVTGNDPVFASVNETFSVGPGSTAMIDDVRVYPMAFGPRGRCTSMMGGIWNGATCTLP